MSNYAEMIRCHYHRIYDNNSTVLLCNFLYNVVLTVITNYLFYISSNWIFWIMNDKLHRLNYYGNESISYECYILISSKFAIITVVTPLFESFHKLWQQVLKSSADCSDFGKLRILQEPIVETRHPHILYFSSFRGHLRKRERIVERFATRLLEKIIWTE